MPESVSRVCIIYPADPLGVIPGGIDTFIRGILRWAPHSVQMSLVGVTTDAAVRPPGRWTSWEIGDRSFRFFPLFELKNAHRQSRIPLSLRFLVKLIGSRATAEADVLEFHRIEPSLAFLWDKRPKTLLLHQNMRDLFNPGADIRWRHTPRLYFLLEDWLLPKLSSIYCVREDAVHDYVRRFPALDTKVRFTPTWVDTEIFNPLDPANRALVRQEVVAELGFDTGDDILVSVGRLDRQKDPLMLLEAFRLLSERNARHRLVFIGGGVLADPLRRQIASYGLEGKVVLAGLKSPTQVARYLQMADVFVLSSRYEGMPMSVLEALGCGLPVACTNVGEVSRVVSAGHNGSIAATHDAEAMSRAIADCLARNAQYRGLPCVLAVTNFTPQKVLEPIYENYRRLARAGAKRSQSGGAHGKP